MKPRLFSDERFLQLLGVLGEDGKPKNQQGDKYRQIHHFINIVEKALGKEVGRRPALRVTDMGSGKGYLTFALHVFLLERGIAVQTSGVELRKDLAITDTLRVMYLEACGYAASLQEFVSLEHTQKNLLIVGRRAAASMNRDHLWKRAQQFQELFGIGHQRMADLLRAAGGLFGTM